MDIHFYLETFGCKVNQYESQSIREAWCGFGWNEVFEPQEASLILINSCAITYNGERDARKALVRLQRLAPQSSVILTGCAARLVFSKLSACERIYLVPQEEKSSLLSASWVTALLTKGEVNNNNSIAYPPFAIQSYRRARPVLKVQDGCSHHCTYCIVPTLRTKPTSRSPEAVIYEARTLLSQGFGELILSGINLKQYGKDHPEYGDFWDLITQLEDALGREFCGRARFRISSVEPTQLNAKGIEVLKKSQMLCPHLHISLQHADPMLLRRMGRGHYTAWDLAHALEAIRSFWPNLALGCDLIVGFPGESDEEYDRLWTFCRDLPFTYAHVFPYSRRPGTAAASFPNQVPEPIRAERAKKLRLLFARKNSAYRAFLAERGQSLSVVFEQKEYSGHVAKGICEYYVPCFLDRDIQTVSLQKVMPQGVYRNGLAVSLL